MTNADKNAYSPAISKDRLMTSKEVMAHLNISKATFYRMANQKRLPPGKRLTPSLIRFRREDIDAWVELHPEWFTRPQKG